MSERPPKSQPAAEGKSDPEALARRIGELADSKGASEIVILDMRKLVSYTDFLTICTARNERQARAIVDEVKLRLKQDWELLPGGIEGEGAAGWIVLDYLDCVLHVFTEEARQRYQLEDLWHEAPRLDLRSSQDGVRGHLYGAAHG
jgi:ribosome-associated protein